MKRLLVLVLMSLSSAGLHAQLSWKKIGVMTEPRFFFASYPISPNEVLMIGGHPGGMVPLDASAACDILNVDTRAIVSGPRMNVPHAAYSSVQMPDGSIIVLGGLTGSVNLPTTDVIERFDPVRRKWDIVGRMRSARMHMASIALDQYRILTVGGRLNNAFNLIAMPTCEVFDLRTGESTLLPEFPVKTCDGSIGRTMTGQILAFGGRGGGAGSDRYAAVYRLDTTSMTWRIGGDFPTPIVTRTAMMLANGGLYVVGGSYREYNERTIPDIVSDGVFRWNGNGFDSIGNMRQGRNLNTVIQYDDSTLLTVGGIDSSKVPLPTCEWIDVRTGVTMSAPRMSLDRAHVSLAGLTRNGTQRVFAIGGLTNDNMATNVVEELALCSPYPRAALTDADVLMAGGAKKANDAVVLTEPEGYTRGAVWSRKAVDVQGGFTTSFTFRMTDGHDADQPDGSIPGADGIVFVVQNTGTTSIGKTGEGIGYEGIPKALAVEFDTYSNPAYSDPNGNHIAVQSGGLGPCRPEHIAPYNLGITTDIVSMVPDGRIYHGRVSYQGGKLSVYLDTTGAFAQPVLVVDSVDIAGLLGLEPTGGAWIGFTSATGKAVERHELLSWDIDACASLVTFVAEDDPRGRSEMHRTYIAPMPSHDAARLYSTIGFREGATLTLFDVTGSTVGAVMVDHRMLSYGIDLPFHPPAGTYLVRIADGIHSVSLCWIVLN